MLIFIGESLPESGDPLTFGVEWIPSIPYTYRLFLIWDPTGLNSQRSLLSSLATPLRERNGLPNGTSRQMNGYISGCWKRGLGCEGLLAMHLILVIMNRVGQQPSLLAKPVILEKNSCKTPFTMLKGIIFISVIVIQDASRLQLVSSL